MSGTIRCHYDFHIHSCLSPCGDADMTPNNIVNMAKLNGLDAIALTDHNIALNCGAVMEVGEQVGLLVMPGMELCTREDVHVICLFETLEGAQGFGREVYDKLPAIDNRPDIFGEQLILNSLDELTGSEPRMLLTAADIGFDEVLPMALSFGGTAFPAHIDKNANGALAVLGGIPPEAGFRVAELSSGCDEAAFLSQNPEVAPMKRLISSDAHYLWQIAEPEHFIELPKLTRSDIIHCMNDQNFL